MHSPDQRETSSDKAASDDAASDDDEADERTAEGDRVAQKALLSAVWGYVLCPGLLHVGSLWSLSRIWVRELPLSSRGHRRAMIAIWLDLPMVLLFALFLSAMLSRILSGPLSTLFR